MFLLIKLDIISDGENGANGLVGKCGKLYDKVELVKTKYKSCAFWFFCGTKVGNMKLGS